MANFEYIKNYTSEFDYVESGESCHELTVTITLCEYRELIERRVRQAAEIEQLKAERDKYEKLVQECGKALFAKHPEAVQSFTDGVAALFGNDSDPEDETEAADACPLTGCSFEGADE